MTEIKSQSRVPAWCLEAAQPRTVTPASWTKLLIVSKAREKLALGKSVGELFGGQARPDFIHEGSDDRLVARGVDFLGREE
jgi:hypothetical protein